MPLIEAKHSIGGDKLMNLPDNLYPHTFENWIALGGFLVPFITMAGSAIWRARTYWREQQQREWQRLQELLETLNNTDGKHGLWQQIAAIRELRTLRVDQVSLSLIVSHALELWLKQAVDVRLIQELQVFQRTLPKPVQ
jgi:hypothetical protein